MKIWIVYQDYDYEGTQVRAVCKTKEIAEILLKKFKQHNRFGEYDIETDELIETTEKANEIDIEDWNEERYKKSLND